MDKRTLLAFGLIFVILIGSQKLMQAFYGSPERGSEPDSTMVQVQPQDTTLQTETAGTNASTTIPSVDRQPEQLPEQDSVELVTSTAEALQFLDQPGLETTVQVETPEYIVTISSLGARFTSWQGKAFPYFQGGVVDLVPRGEQATGTGFDMVGFSGLDLDLGPINFTINNHNDLVLDENSGSRQLVFSVETRGGLEIQKTYTFHPGRYDIDMELAVLAVNPAQAGSALQFTGNPSVFRFGWNQGIASTERNRRMETPAFRSFAKIGEDLHFKKHSDLQKSVEKVYGLYEGSIFFAGVQNQYFNVVGIVPQEPGSPVVGAIELSGNQATQQQSWRISVPARRNLERENVIASNQISLLIGPCEKNLLESFGMGLIESMNLGWKFFRPMSEGVLFIMDLMHKFIPNYGVIIILFSLLTKVMFWPLTRKSTESMRRMQELQPKIKALQEKYKDNKEKLSQAQMEMYKKEKVNPMAGCLPLLVQSPVFIALYQSLSHTIALRATPFVLWMKDLSQPDAMFQLPVNIPFLGSDFNLLPILMSVAMYFQTKLTPTGTAGGQMAVMNTMMPLLMLFFFYNMPSGLVLYWLVNTILQIHQSWKIQKTAPATEGAQSNE